jgi:hypothetical protein
MAIDWRRRVVHQCFSSNSILGLANKSHDDGHPQQGSLRSDYCWWLRAISGTLQPPVRHRRQSLAESRGLPQPYRWKALMDLVELTAR